MYDFSLQLRKDPATLRREAQTDAVLRAKEEEIARRRALAAMAEHMLQPATLHTFEIHGARNTRRSLLDPIFQPLVDETRNVGTTLGDVFQDVQEAVGKLERFGESGSLLRSAILCALFYTHPCFFSNESNF